ncbi:RES family NAD+ phosphorylase [Agrobacterium tumefaciens]|uniref:RES family NAD+ phosphorylase n=1 Tax=Agrobacterium tumefaciens TaxID=358 RepID=UPI001FCDA2A0|nr:RES family NAD+ phosphorylase [Agrobacterium tumefaciens]
MKLDPATVADLALAFRPDAWLRVLPRAHIATPLGMGFGNSRFSSPHRRFRLAYIAQDLPTAIAETIVRDRFEGSADRVLDETEFDDWAVAEVSAVDPLTVLDLRTTGLLRLGVSTDAARAKTHNDGQELSDAVYGAFDADGLLYASRLTGAHCLAIYDRAVARKLAATPAIELLRHPGLVPALKEIGVSVQSARSP